LLLALNYYPVKAGYSCAQRFRFDGRPDRLCLRRPPDWCVAASLALRRDKLVAGFANLVVLDLECADPPALTEFYHQVLGWDISLSQPEYAEISNGATRILFTRREGYKGAGWPESASPKRYHLCMRTSDVADAVRRCLDLGASKPEFQPGDGKWTVLLDPAGHPFCLAQDELTTSPPPSP
jgi:predicted enzyme related to lactoylglutathione lyase